MSDKYTDEQIKVELKRALEIGDAPIGMHWGCSLNKQLVSDTLDLINCQEAEIDELSSAILQLVVALENAKYEAAKEFAERLKESAFECDVSFGFGREHYTEAVTVVEIDNLVKEMAGENAAYGNAKTTRSS